VNKLCKNITKVLSRKSKYL